MSSKMEDWNDFHSKQSLRNNQVSKCGCMSFHPYMLLGKTFSNTYIHKTKQSHGILTFFDVLKYRLVKYLCI